MTPVHIPTRPFIKAWLERQLPDGIVDRNHFVGALLMNLLKRDTNHHGSKSVSYQDTVTVYIGGEERRKQGAWLNVTETMQFNNMLGEIIRKEIRTHIITYLYFDPRLNKAIEYARKQSGMDMDIMSDDAIIKDYQRWRIKNGGTRIYKKPLAAAA